MLVCELGVLVAEHSPAGINEAVLGVFRGQNTVEHVDPAGNKRKQVPGRAHPHHVAGAVFGQVVGAKIRDFVHGLYGFAYRKATHGVAVGSEFLESLDGFFSEFLVHAALHNPEKVLRVAVERRIFAEPVHGAAGPFERQVQRVRGLLDGARVRRAFVKSHDDVGADFALGQHHGFGRELVAAAVQQALKFHAVFSNVAKILEAPDLESAAVGEHGAVPAHELLHAARLGNQLGARAQVQVVRIRQNDLRLHFAQVPRRKSLYARERAHWHKNRRFYHAVGGVEPTAAGLALVACLDEFEGILIHGAKSSKK